MAKIKHLVCFFLCYKNIIYKYLYFIFYNLFIILLCFFQLLAKEQEVEEKTHHLKAAIAEIDSLKSEVSRLRRYEDELNNVQVSKIFDNCFI